MEALKNPPGLARRDSDSVVLNRKRHASVLGPSTQDNLPGVIGILPGVVEEVDQCRRQGVRIRHDVRQLRLDLHFKTAVRRGKTFAHSLDRSVNDLAGWQGPEV